MRKARDAQTVLLNIPEYQKCQSISIFMSMPKGEVQTKDIVRHALQSGKKVFIPYIYKSKQSGDQKPDSIMDMLHLTDEDDYQSLTPDKWGIPSIDASTVEKRTNCFGGRGLSEQCFDSKATDGLDVIIVPAVAFDQELNRLGHGKGYYDNFISRYRKRFSDQEPTKRRPYLSTCFRPL